MFVITENVKKRPAYAYYPNRLGRLIVTHSLREK